MSVQNILVLTSTHYFLYSFSIVNRTRWIDVFFKTSFGLYGLLKDFNEEVFGFFVSRESKIQKMVTGWDFIKRTLVLMEGQCVNSDI